MNIDKALENIDYESIYTNKPRPRSYDPRSNKRSSTGANNNINRADRMNNMNIGVNKHRHRSANIRGNKNMDDVQIINFQQQIAKGMDIPTITEPTITRDKRSDRKTNNYINSKKMKKEMKKLTQGYREVPADEFNGITSGSEILYLSKRKQKELPKRVIVIKHGINKGKPGMKLCNKDIAINKNNPFGGWWVQYRNIKKIWVKACDLSHYNKIMVEDIINFINEKFGEEFQNFMMRKYQENPKRYEPLSHFS